MATHLRLRLAAAQTRLAALALTFGVSGLAGCPDTALNECYEDTECTAGTVCSAGGRCAPPTGLDASVDGSGGGGEGGGGGGVGGDARIPDRGGAADLGPEMAVDRGAEAGPDAGLDAAVDASGDAAPEMGPDAAVPSITCEVKPGPFDPQLRLSPEPFGYDLVITEGAQGTRVVRAVGRQPVANGGPPEAGRMMLYCAPLGRIDLPDETVQIEVGATTSYSDGRPMVKMLVSEAGTPQARLHVGWWVIGGTPGEDLQPRWLRGVSLGLDANGCPSADEPRATWEVPAHPYSGGFGLVWLRGALQVSVARPVMGDFFSQQLVPVATPEASGLRLLSSAAGQLSLVGTANGEQLDAFGSLNPGAGEVTLHARVGFDAEGILRLDSAEEDDARTALAPARLLAAVPSEPGRFGVLSQLLPIVENPGPPCEGEGGPYPESNGTPQQLRLQVVEPGRGPAGAGEVVFQVFGTPTRATGDPLYADLAWHGGQQHFGLAYITHHGSATAPDFNGVRLAVLDATGEVQQHLNVASYRPSCQTLPQRPLVVPTPEGFLVTWLHEYSYLRHTRIDCNRPQQ